MIVNLSELKSRLEQEWEDLTLQQNHLKEILKSVEVIRHYAARRDSSVAATTPERKDLPDSSDLLVTDYRR